MRVVAFRKRLNTVIIKGGVKLTPPSRVLKFKHLYTFDQNNHPLHSKLTGHLYYLTVDRNRIGTK